MIHLMGRNIFTCMNMNQINRKNCAHLAEIRIYHESLYISIHYNYRFRLKIKESGSTDTIKT